MGMRIEEELGCLLRGKKLSLAAAESCTGGMFGARITSVSGSSQYFRGGIIAYTNGVKTDLLGVDEDILKSHGAVSGETAVRMAEGVRKALHADIGIGITGIAGPGGGTVGKPVGLVFIGLAAGKAQQVNKFVFEGDREAVRQQITEAALEIVKNSILERT